MTLIKSISGIRGTLGGYPGEGLTPQDVVKFTSAFGTLVLDGDPQNRIVVGRDARSSGVMVSQLVNASLIGLGLEVIDLGLATTPTTAMAVTHHRAGGGIIITASHNPANWNALKLLGPSGEFISAELGDKIVHLAEQPISYAEVDQLGQIIDDPKALERHIDAILELPEVDTSAISSQNFSIAIDSVNSVGGIAMPQLLGRLGVNKIHKINCEPNGRFNHNPEPLPQHLSEIQSLMEKGAHDLGIVVDPDVDRLSFICENGEFFGEEYTLVAVADHLLNFRQGNTVSNLSSSRALRDVTIRKKGQYYASAVGEVNVVDKMKEVKAIIGGEGNGGVIYPQLHNGRDAMVGTALFLTHLAKSGKKASEMKHALPEYHMSKNKIQVKQDIGFAELLANIAEMYPDGKTTTTDGLKIDFPNSWIHLRQSNTEPIIRIYTEAPDKKMADNLAQDVMEKIRQLNSQPTELS